MVAVAEPALASVPAAVVEVAEEAAVVVVEAVAAAPASENTLVCRRAKRL